MAKKSFVFSAFLAGVLLGGATMAALSWWRTGEEVRGDPTTRPINGRESSVGETDRLLARIGQQAGEINRLKELLEEATTEKPEPVEEVVEEPAQPTRMERMQARMDERMNQRVDSLFQAYGLSEAQRQLVEEIYRQRRDNFMARRNGEEVVPFNLDAALEGVMTDEQFARYLEDTQEEIYNRAEMIATTQLVRMSQQMDLPEEQQNLVYDTIHTAAQEAMIARQAGESFDMRSTINERLSTILTPEQIQAMEQTNILGGEGGWMGGFSRGPGR
ncbi:MAG: hypothetical protein ACO3ZW_09320 [Opitutales bacterium]|jgi:hypothetical protein